MDNNHDEKMAILVTTCGQCPEIYNRISNDLYKTFGIQGAEICLIAAYYVINALKEKERENK